jgi:hypothetical protein
MRFGEPTLSLLSFSEMRQMQWNFISSPICYNPLHHRREYDKCSVGPLEFCSETVIRRQDEILPSSVRKNRYSQHNLQPKKPNNRNGTN